MAHQWWYTVCPEKSVTLTISENIPKPRNKFRNFFNCTDTPNPWPKHMWVLCKFSHASLHNIHNLFRGFGIFSEIVRVTLFSGHTVDYLGLFATRKLTHLFWKILKIKDVFIKSSNRVASIHFAKCIFIIFHENLYVLLIHDIMKCNHWNCVISLWWGSRKNIYSQSLKMHSNSEINNINCLQFSWAVNL